MKIELARRILEIGIEYDNDEVDIPHDMLKRQYKRQALIYHPDKNKSPNAIERFREAKEAFDTLEGYYGYGDCDMNILDDSFSESVSHCSYLNIMISFIQYIIKMETMTDEHSMVFSMIMEKLSNCCENQAIIILQKIELGLLIKIHKSLTNIKHILHIPDSIIDKIKSIIIIKESECSHEQLVLYPTLDDLFNHNVYITHRNNHKIMIPLWASELVYEMNEQRDLIITCVPIVPSNIYIESNNDIIVDLDYDIGSFWGKSEIDVYIGQKSIKIHVSCIKFQDEQVILFENEGIPRFNEDSIYNISNKSTIVINLRLTNNLVK